MFVKDLEKVSHYYLPLYFILLLVMRTCCSIHRNLGFRIHDNLGFAFLFPRQAVMADGQEYSYCNTSKQGSKSPNNIFPYISECGAEK